MNYKEPTPTDYAFRDIEPKWQEYWLLNRTFKTTDCLKKPKYYVLDMFPYPSGDGLHVGHPEGYTATDIIARYKRMNGFNVLHPMGWDAFGLPAEQHAIKTGTHPRATTVRNISNFRRQIQSIGLSYDWDREVDTTAEDYYKWTQWIFLKLYERGLAYESHEAVNWCPALGTVLANEEVVNGVSEVGSHPVEKRRMRQWVLKITAYADRLIDDLEEVDWPESVKEMQRNWIGRSYGATVSFRIAGHEDKCFDVFTTRPDTLFGATFCVLAPEHPLVAQIADQSQSSAIQKYVADASQKSEIDRCDDTKDKTGVSIGAYAIHPLNGTRIPIFIADYVLMSYGSGAIMAVPGHDQRDYEFAKKFGLPILQVIDGGDKADLSEAAYSGDGHLINSDFLNGLDKNSAIEQISAYLEKNGLGKKTKTYKLRDWLFSRQRYWGEPFPLVHGSDGSIHAVSESELPVKLPNLDNFEPTGTGEPPLMKATEWVQYNKDGKSFSRETNTMPQWAGSCWYYLRFIDPKNTEQPWDREKEKYWMPVDLYVGGVEHAVLHLLYARFWHKVLYDIGAVSTKEPFKRLVNQGMILGDNGEKMSKSRGNVVNPDQVIIEWGADSLRLYEMFMGPLEQVKPWQTNGILGVHRFLKRVWRMSMSESIELSEFVKTEETDTVTKALHATIKKVTDDTENMRFNTAISAMMEFVNCVYKEGAITKASLKSFILILSPYAPHIGEEIWHRLGNKESLAYESWPKFDERFITDDTFTMPVMVNGKVRGTLQLPKDVSKEMALSLARELPAVARQIEGKTISKEIYVQGKILNLVMT